ncbi:acyltransferase domain-containing protein [Xanthomonas arboricola]|uniref:acyltransferase domain-containing protein n=1 Tax=Xanthomonas arboricola TaxID=56448 RepID=UPI001613B3EF|nr:acyltransferase domain-containing protein [Xanthomonas arboricola]MBB5862361.1 acyl transferase domain-containing protein [Xanthomonas arboricola]
MQPLKTIFMFSGQGSQYYRMGEPLYQGNEVFRHWMDRLDAHALALCGTSIVRMIYDPARSRSDPFARTPLSGLAIFMVEYAMAKALEAAHVHADLTLGASLGSYAAAAVAGAITPGDALAAILRQSRIMEQHCPPGGMLAIVADPTLYDTPEIATRAELAAVNFSSHFVVAGLDAALDEVERFLDARTVPYQRLPVTHAFHSRWIDAARQPLRWCFDGLPMGPARMPVVCCAKAINYETLPEDFFWHVVRDPIAFAAAVQRLEALESFHYLDVGPSGTLATFLNYLLPAGSASRIGKVLSPLGGELKSFGFVTAG